MPEAFAPASRRRRACASTAAALRAVTTTWAPEAASASAIPPPIPRVPPVTSATRPVRSKEGGFSMAMFLG